MGKHKSFQETNSTSQTGENKTKNHRHHNRATKGNNTRKKVFDVDYSELRLRWEEELAFYVASNRYKIYKEKLSNGNFEYRVRDEYGQIVITIESARNVVFSPKRRRRKRRR